MTPNGIAQLIEQLESFNSVVAASNKSFPGWFKEKDNGKVLSTGCHTRLRTQARDGESCGVGNRRRQSRRGGRIRPKCLPSIPAGQLVSHYVCISRLLLQEEREEIFFLSPIPSSTGYVTSYRLEPRRQTARWPH